MEKEKTHKFVIDRWKRAGKVNLLTVRRKSKLKEPIFSVKIRPPIPVILFKTPEWLKDFVDKMNRGEIKLR